MKYFGRTEYMAGANQVRKLAWAIYEGEERDGYVGKEPVAWFLKHEDAARFTGMREPEPAPVGSAKS